MPYAFVVLCPRHGIAAAPDGRCILCRRQDKAVEIAVRRGRDPLRRLAVVIVAIMAALAAFALAGALLDTR
ncbi:MAG TPA: hypothetical protein VKU41_13555 [Polyangiaceae bacterium]|nr:hypothetical protein [Polyangiaceae bacterium]